MIFKERKIVMNVKSEFYFESRWFDFHFYSETAQRMERVKSSRIPPTHCKHKQKLWESRGRVGYLNDCIIMARGKSSELKIIIQNFAERESEQFNLSLSL